MSQPQFLAVTFLTSLREATGDDWNLYLKAIDAMRDAQAIKSGYEGKRRRRKFAFPIQRVSIGLKENIVIFKCKRKNEKS